MAQGVRRRSNRKGRRGQGSRTGRGPGRRVLGGAGLALVAAVAVALAPRASGGQAEPIATLQTADFHALAFGPPDEPDVVFFGHHNGVMRSQDGGRTWRPLVSQPNFDAMALAVGRGGPRRSSTLYLAGHDVFLVSPDGGVSWQRVEHDLPGTDIHGFAMSPDDPSRLYAFVVGHGLFASADGGRTWRRLPGSVPRDVTAVAVTAGDPATLYVGSASQGVVKTTDGGSSFHRAATGLGAGPVLSLAVDPSAHQTVYAGLDGGLYKSADGGSTWRRLPFPGHNAVALAVSPTRPNVLLAVSVEDRRGLVFRSENGGATWGPRS